ncbi:MAG TPA: NAD(+) synthase, partial [Ruminococcaceae bacterium]|nr:NAD(+) synthase [Oscillospiraceae bacterium]
MKDGFFRIAVATPKIRVADCEYNKNSVLAMMRECAARGAGAVAFPELCLTGYTCGDLFRGRALVAGAERALGELMAQTAELDLLA